MDFKKLENEITKEFNKFLSDIGIPTSIISKSLNDANIGYKIDTNKNLDWNTIKKKYKIKDTKEIKEKYYKVLNFEILFFNKFSTFDVDV